MIHDINPSNPSFLALDTPEVNHSPLGFAISQVIAHGSQGDHKFDSIRSISLLNQAMKKESSIGSEDEVLNEAIEEQAYRLQNLLKKIYSFRSSFDQINPDRISSDKEGYYKLNGMLEKSYLDTSVADLMLKPPPEDLQYEHWKALVGALAKKIELTEGTLRVDPDFSDLIKQGLVRKYDLTTENNLQAISFSAQQYILEHKDSSVNLELIKTELNDSRLLFLLNLFKDLPLSGLNVSENPIQLENKKTIDLLKTFVSLPFFSLTLSEGEGLNLESVETLNQSLGMGSRIEIV